MSDPTVAYLLAKVSLLADLLTEEKGRRQDLEAAIRKHRDIFTNPDTETYVDADAELWAVLGDE